MTEQELMAYIRANMPTLTDVQSSPSEAYGSATAGQGLTTRYNSAALSNLFGDSATLLPNIGYQVNGDQQTTSLDPSQGYRFRVGDIEAMYGPDGKLTDVFKQKPDSFMMQAMRAVMPAVALAAGGAAALGAGGVGAGGAAGMPATGGIGGLVDGSTSLLGAGTGGSVAGGIGTGLDLGLGAGAAGAAGAGGLGAAAAAPIVASSPSWLAGVGSTAGMTPAQIAGAAGSAAGGISAGGGMNWGSLLSDPGTWMQGLGGVAGAIGSGMAAGAQEDAAKDAIAEQRRQYDLTRSDLQPWMQTGAAGLNSLAGLLGLNGGSGSLMKPFTGADLASEPGYAFGQQQGEQAINRAAAGRGSFDSGATLRNLMRFNSDYGGTKFNEAFNRDQAQKGNQYNWLAGISGAGQSATGQVANAGTNTANNVGELMTGAGNARASGYVGATNALSGSLGNITNNWMQQNMLSQILGRR